MTELQKNQALYVQIASLMRSEIYSEKYVFGEKLPTENELCDRFSVSKITVRKAIQMLEKQGLVKKIQGKGTFVQYVKEVKEIGKTPMGFYDFYSSKGHRVKNDFLQTKIINDKSDSLPSAVVKNISFPLYYVQRLISENDLPVGIDNIYVSANIFPKFIENMISLNDLYKVFDLKYGVKIAKSKLNISGISANEYLAKKLDCLIGDPLFVVDKLGYSADKKVMHFSSSIVRCDRVEYTFTI